MKKREIADAIFAHSSELHDWARKLELPRHEENSPIANHYAGILRGMADGLWEEAKGVRDEAQEEECQTPQN
jgi:hypothetical protein